MIIWWVEVNNEVDIVNMDATRGNIRRDQYGQAAVGELAQRPFTFVLAQIPVD